MRRRPIPELLRFLSLAAVGTAPQAAAQPGGPSGMEYDGAAPNLGGFAAFLAALQASAAPQTGQWNYAALANASGQTWSNANLSGFNIPSLVMLRSGAAGVSDTTDTALNIAAAIPNPYVGQTALLVLGNANTGTLTVVAGTNVTLGGTTTTATLAMRLFQIKITNLANYLLAGAASTNTTTTSAAVATSTPGTAPIIPVTSATGIIVGSQLVVWTGAAGTSAPYVVGTVTNVSSTNITIAANVANAIPSGANVSVYNTAVTLTGMFAITGAALTA